MKRILLIGLFLVCATAGKAQYKLYTDGLERYNQKDYFGAVELLSDFLTRPIRDKKFDVDAHYWRGLASIKVSDFEASIEDLQQALALKHPNQGNIHWFIAKAHFSLNHFPEAIDAYTQALAFFSKDNIKKAQLLADRSSAQLKAGQKDLARADLEQSLKLQPGIISVEEQLRNLDANSSAIAQSSPPVQKKSEPPATVIETRLVPPAGKEIPSSQEAQEVRSIPAPAQSNVAAQESEELSPEELYKNDKRFALVIGNSSYTAKVGPLRNPVNDATAFANTIKQMNFEVTLITDATYGKIRAEMLKFREKLNQGEKDGTVGLFYYAGHGLQHDNENYIVPVDAELEFEDDIPRYCFPIQKMVLNQLETTNSRMNIIVLDACRNNPFPAMNRGIGENQGLGEMRKARGAFIAYATSPGSVASDGTGSNGLYTQELIKAMQRPGRTIEQVFKDVRANVLKLSGDRQNPWENSNIIGDFYFKFR